jgi:hypothetical protein
VWPTGALWTTIAASTSLPVGTVPTLCSATLNSGLLQSKLSEGCAHVAAGWNGWGMLDAAVSNPGAITARFSAARAASLSIARFFLTGEQSSAQLLSGPGERRGGGFKGRIRCEDPPRPTARGSLHRPSCFGTIRPTVQANPIQTRARPHCYAPLPPPSPHCLQGSWTKGGPGGWTGWCPRRSALAYASPWPGPTCGRTTGCRALSNGGWGCLKRANLRCPRPHQHGHRVEAAALVIAEA